MRPACVLIEMPFVWQPKSCWADDVDARVLFFSRAPEQRQMTSFSFRVFFTSGIRFTYLFRIPYRGV